MVLLIVGLVTAALTPGVVRTVSHGRVDRAANAISAQFYLAQSLAGRQRKPVTVTISSSAKTIVIAGGVTGTVYSTRYFGSESEFNLPALTATPVRVYVLPSGLVNAAILVDVGNASYRRQVRMTKAGQVRILR